MLKRTYFILTSLFILFSFSFSSVFAQTETGQGSAGSVPSEEAKLVAPDSIFPYPGTNRMPFAGQNHNYSVVYRDNGEAIVTLRVTLTNTKDSGNLSEVSLRLPRVKPEDLSVYQIIAQGPCLRYAEQPAFISVMPRCLEYGDPDYTYYYGSGKYQKAKTELSGDTLKVTLPTEIANQKSGSFFVYFRTFGLASKNLFGAYKYSFESLKVDDQINEMNIGISTDADQYLKGVKGRVDYNTTEASVALKAAPAADAGAVANTQIDRFVQQIGQGQIIKNASNLASMESYKVNGMYASSGIRLYGKEILIGLLVLLFIISLAILVVKKFIVGSQKSSKTASSKEDLGNTMVLSLGVSFVSALLSAGYSFVVYYITSSLNSVYLGYGYQSLVGILVVVISFAIYTLLILGPAFLIGFKKSVGWGIATFVMTILWLILLGIIAITVVFMLGSGNDYSPITPLSKSREIMNASEPAAQ